MGEEVVYLGIYFGQGLPPCPHQDPQSSLQWIPQPLVKLSVQQCLAYYSSQGSWYHWLAYHSPYFWHTRHANDNHTCYNGTLALISSSCMHHTQSCRQLSRCLRLVRVLMCEDGLRTRFRWRAWHSRDAFETHMHCMRIHSPCLVSHTHRILILRSRPSLMIYRIINDDEQEANNWIDEIMNS